MTDGLPDLPDWIDEKLEFDEQKDVQDHHIVHEFLKTEEPYLSVSKLSRAFDFSKPGMRPRLENLEEADILDSKAAAGGRIYWIRDERSEWPIPPDVEVVPVDDELTVSELLDQGYVRAGAIAVVCGMAGIIFMMGFVTTLAFEADLGFNAPNLLLILGLFTGTGSIVIGLIAVGAWLVR